MAEPAPHTTPDHSEEESIRSHNHSMRNALAATALIGAVLPGGVIAHEAVSHDHIAAEVTTDTITTTLPSDPSELVVTIPANVQNEYQVDFQTDQHDKEASEQQVNTLLESVLEPSDWSKVTAIEITGLASAEDESPDEGLQKLSVPNTDLAEQRGELAHQAVRGVFAEHGIQSDVLTKVNGREDTWSDDELNQGEALAAQFGYTDVANMVAAYNTAPEDAPPAVNEFLHPLLEARRGATIKLTLEQPNEAGRTITITVPKVVLNSVSETLDVEHSKITTPDVIGYIPTAFQKVSPPKASKSNNNITRGLDLHSDSKKPPIRGQKPIRHRGRTHMTGPRW